MNEAQEITVPGQERPMTGNPKTCFLPAHPALGTCWLSPRAPWRLSVTGLIPFLPSREARFSSIILGQKK